jgi:hypothetical protein
MIQKSVLRSYVSPIAVWALLAATAGGPALAQVVHQVTDAKSDAFRIAVTDDAGTDIFVASTADPFATNPRHAFQIFRYVAATGAGVQVTTFRDGASDTMVGLSVSDDGQWLAFISRGNLTGQNHDRSPELFTMARDGSSLVQVTNDPGPNGTVHLQAKANVIANELYVAQNELDQATAKYLATKSQLDDATAKFDDISAQLDARTRAAYIEGSGSNLGFILGSTSFADLSDRVEYMNALARNDADLAAQVESLKIQLASAAAAEQKLRQQKLAAVAKVQEKNAQDFANSELTGFMDFDPAERRIQRLRIVTTKAAYNTQPFATAMVSKSRETLEALYQ